MKYNYYPKPWGFKEINDTYYVCDANGLAICMMMWPCHSIENTDSAVNEVEALAKEIAEIGNQDK